jgi:hypothetical protein
MKFEGTSSDCDLCRVLVASFLACVVVDRHSFRGGEDIVQHD